MQTPQSPEVFQEEVYLSPGGRVDYTVGSWLPSYLQGKIGKVYTQKHLFTRDSDSASCGASAIGKHVSLSSITILAVHQSVERPSLPLDMQSSCQLQQQDIFAACIGF